QLSGDLTTVHLLLRQRRPELPEACRRDRDLVGVALAGGLAPDDRVGGRAAGGLHAGRRRPRGVGRGGSARAAVDLEDAVARRDAAGDGVGRVGRVVRQHGGDGAGARRQAAGQAAGAVALAAHDAGAQAPDLVREPRTAAEARDEDLALVDAGVRLDLLEDGVEEWVLGRVGAVRPEALADGREAHEDRVALR